MTESVILAIIGTVFAVVGVVVSAIHVDRIWSNWKGEHVIRHIVAICSIVPV